ncbi:cupin domain-containing protein [Devosia salina]|uniref:Cupin domain-containing protein n=1 Tax=Devosia salina TaxID=2860336 RepID=A0ABX8WEG5_9HYPH|nr:cupin domain-containing protein [Devosia salina]QYO76029.1 cupin domain-containing protein [Devosia salina]
MCRAECSCGSSCPQRLSSLPRGVHLLRARQDQVDKTIKFQGGVYGANTSFFAVSVEPGSGPGLHVHPYAEVWIVRRGQAAFQAGGQDVVAGPGDILVVEASVPHKFTSIGEERLDMVCIHDSGNIVQHPVDQ